MTTNRIRWTALLLPWLLVPTTAAVFRTASVLWGADVAVLAGFLAYQIVWCLLLPIMVLGKERFLGLFRKRGALAVSHRRILAAWLLAAGTIAGALVSLPATLAAHRSAVLLLGAVPTVFNGICEEILWRGLYLEAFGGNRWLSVLYPSAGFALWHLSPQLVRTGITAADVLPLVALAFCLGIVYGAVTALTRSIRLSAAAHSLIGLIAYGVPISTSLASLLGIPAR